MAPALSVTPQEAHSYDIDEDLEKSTPHRRRALASVDNLAPHMEEDDMGLQNQPSLAKDSQEMEQILVDLGNSDLAQADLLQAIKTFETGGEGLSAGDDNIYSFSGLDLADSVESDGDVPEDRIRLMQSRLERRSSFLHRRIRILQARFIGKRVSEEAAQTFEKCIKGARKDGGGRPVGLKAFLKRIETTSALQASAASRTVVGPKYYRAASTRVDASKSASVGISPGTLTGLEDTAGALRSHLSVVKRELDSDATASSSGAESNDETVTYNNPHQQHMPIEKRALWTWQKYRAAIASRWMWLQANVQELEYKIRQYGELKDQIREAKGPVEFEGEPVAYVGSLPGAEPTDDDPSSETCARVRPLRRETFMKRKLLQMHNFHIATSKTARPTDIRCSCEAKLESCAVCTGRGEPTQPAPPAATLPPSQRVARVCPTYHPSLSDAADISPWTHLSAQVSRAWVRGRGRRHRAPAAAPAAASPSPSPSPAPAAASTPPRLARRHHPTRLKRGRPPLSRKIRERDREDDSSVSNHERRGRSSTESRLRRQSYDIDNIVIPQSVAANTRPQILTYKEILTPKWRVMEIPEGALNNGVMKANDNIFMESEDEDISEPAVAARHARAEVRERSRYARKSRARRIKEAETNFNDEQNCIELPVQEMPVQQEIQQQMLPVLHNETVRPYSPRRFPLPDSTYVAMMSVMPDGYRCSSPDPLPADDDSSSLSPLSVTAFDGDDPDDAEWDPSSEKVERRKSAFR